MIQAYINKAAERDKLCKKRRTTLFLLGIPALLLLGITVLFACKMNIVGAVISGMAALGIVAYMIRFYIVKQKDIDAVKEEMDSISKRFVY